MVSTQVAYFFMKNQYSSCLNSCLIVNQSCCFTHHFMVFIQNCDKNGEKLLSISEHSVLGCLFFWKISVLVLISELLIKKNRVFLKLSHRLHPWWCYSCTDVKYWIRFVLVIDLTSVQLQINHESFTEKTFKFVRVRSTRTNLVFSVNDEWFICNCTQRLIDYWLIGRTTENDLFKTL